MLGNLVIFQYDTGSDITVIGKKDSPRSPKLSERHVVKHTGDNELDIIGKFYCAI